MLSFFFSFFFSGDLGTQIFGVLLPGMFNEMGISIDQYRCTIGTYCRAPTFSKNAGRCTNNGTSDTRGIGGLDLMDDPIYIMFIFLYFLIISYLTIISMSIILKCTPGRQNYKLKIGFLNIIPSFLVPNGYLLKVLFLQLCTKVIWCINNKVNDYPHKKTISNFLFDNRNLTFMKFVSTLISLWLFSVNIILIIMCNMSLLNPGPSGPRDELSVYSHNIQGLVGFDSLGNPNPNLNLTKLYELQAYAYHHRPDIIALNETWLKPSIKNNEILDPDIYKIFRLDRSPLTHPSDPNNDKKFRKNGGGVLIAVRKELGLKPTICKSSCQAELLTIKLGNSMYISTFYRVGTLGCQNHQEVDSHLKCIAKN